MWKYDEVAGNEAFAEDFQQAMTYYTKQSLVGGDVDLQEAYDWRSAKVNALAVLSPQFSCSFLFSDILLLQICN